MMTVHDPSRSVRLVRVPPHSAELEILRDRGVDVDAALGQLRDLEIETPSWGYGNSGTRFHVYPWPGAAHDA
jgi:L-rhamnose isomerase/sugar isomerase